MAKDRMLRWTCQRKSIVYTTSPTGKTLKHGICRDCYERQAGSGRTGMGSQWKDRRTEEEKEDVCETKYGTGHG